MSERAMNIVLLLFTMSFVLPTRICVADEHESHSEPAIKEGVWKVDPGEIVNIQSGAVTISVDKFTMGERSSIKISDKTPVFIIIAKEAKLEDNTSILGFGRDGENPGDDGQDAPTVILFFENASLSGLDITSRGGNGEEGKPGKKGSRGRSASCSGRDAGNGSRGGDGGPGGDGGDGGDIFVFLPAESGPLGLSTRSDGGIGGKGGQFGIGGSGGAGRKRCGPWPYWKKGRGRPGPSGSPGKEGIEGEKGEVKISFMDSFDPDSIESKLETLLSDLKKKRRGLDLPEQKLGNL